MNDSYNTDDMANLETVFYFEFDQATLTVKARKALDAQIARLKKTTGPVRLEGHADERGTREYNIALAERRAISVADYMAINGIPRYRIETVSYGEERPVAFGQSESTYSQNRRVELK
jgi:peptidoglycan-associated lipoprotein